MGLLQKAGASVKPPMGKKAQHRGFLDLAETFRASDEIERMCVERLTRLPVSSGTPYTALTVLKAYFPAFAEIILQKSGDSLRICESVGISDTHCGDDPVSVPGLELELPPEGYHTIPVSSLHFESLPNDCNVFAFPILVGLSTVGFLLFITKETDRALLSSIQRIVRACPKKFILEKEIVPIASQKKGIGLSAEAAAENGLQALGECHILVCNLASSADTVSEETLKQLAQSRLGNLGIAFILSDNRLCVFLKSTLDRELYAHQLAKSLRSALSLAAEDFSVTAQGYAADKAEALAIISRKS